MTQQTSSIGRSHLADVVAGSNSLERRFRFMDEFIRVLLIFAGVLSIAITIGIIIVLGVESSLFLSSRAWVIAKIPVVSGEPVAALQQSIDTADITFPITFDAERIPFTSGQFIQLGDEVMRITERATRTITVERGADHTQAAAHAADTPILPMREEQIKNLTGIDATQTTLEIGEGRGKEFYVGQEIQIDLEVMRINAISEDGAQLTVERGTSDTEAVAHDEGKQILFEKPVTLGEFFTSTVWSPQVGNFGVLPLLTATLLTSFIGLMVAIPLGLGAAIYLSEYASQRVRNILKPILEILAGIPTVVFGFFALTVVTPGLQSIFGEGVQFYNMLSAGLVIGVLLVPLISSLSEDALSAVPRSLREASYGLGATKLETTIRVVLPAAISGITAAIILAASRAVGETMVAALASGAGPNFTFNVFTGAETMTGHIARISGGDLSYNSIDYNSIFAIGAVLFVVTLILNLVSYVVSERVREEY